VNIILLTFVLLFVYLVYNYKRRTLRLM